MAPGVKAGAGARAAGRREASGPYSGAPLRVHVLFAVSTRPGRSFLGRNDKGPLSPTTG